MLENVHAYSITQGNRQPNSQDGSPEFEISEKHQCHHKKKEPWSPGSIIGEESQDPISPWRSPFPVYEDLELLFHTASWNNSLRKETLNKESDEIGGLSE